MSDRGSHAPPLPSLNALYAFDAAARHESFTRAARELGVTQTAISHQIKSLESELAVTLFRRSSRRLVLTPEGLLWSAELRVIFQRLRDANARLRAKVQGERPVVAVSVMPSFGARWLVPRLGRFMERFPEVDVRLSASERLVDFEVEPFDLGIRFGAGRYPGLCCEKLADDAWVVVASPALIARTNLCTIHDLARCNLLVDDQPGAWDEWFEAAGAPPVSPLALIQITDSSMLVEAALRGQGVGLARWSLACDELRGGRLALVYSDVEPLRTKPSYYLVGPRESVRRTPVQAFCEWLRKEAETLRDLGSRSGPTMTTPTVLQQGRREGGGNPPAPRGQAKVETISEPVARPPNLATPRPEATRQARGRQTV